MHTIFNLYPPAGWHGYADAELLSQLIWDGDLSEEDGNWHYMNPTSRISIWESAIDGSSIIMYYDDDDRLAELQVNPGLAYQYLLPLIQRFSLITDAPV